MPNGSSKGKEVDKSSSWSQWAWDDRGYYYSSRYGPTGQLEYEYRYPEAKTPQQEQQTPRTPGENVFYSPSSAAPSSSSGTSGGGYDAQEGHSGVAQKTSANTTTPSYQIRPATTYPSSESYYTTAAASGSQTSSSTATNTSYSSQLARPGSSASNTGSYNSSVASPKSDYASSSQSYDVSSDVTVQLRGMSLNSVPSTIPEQGYVGSSSAVTSYQPQPSNYIGRAPNSSDKEKLDPRYRCISEREQRKFWKVGRVFMMLWTEPAAAAGTTRNGTHYSTVWLDQGVYSEIRRFVVIKEGYGNSICSPIHTYNGQATLKPNLPERQQHAIIYTGKECPPEHSYTTSDGTFLKENLSKDPIRVRREQNGPEGDLGAFSRLNYSKIYTVENYVRVLNIGMVERDWIPALNANSYMRPSETPVEKPTIRSNDSEKKSKGKGKEGRRHRR